MLLGGGGGRGYMQTLGDVVEGGGGIHADVGRSLRDMQTLGDVAEWGIHAEVRRRC